MTVALSSEDRRSQTVATAIKIRDAAEADLPAIIDIYNAAVATRMSTAQLEPVTIESRRDWLNDHTPNRHPFWVLECEAAVAGWLTFKAFIPRCAYHGTAELSVYVDERFSAARDCEKIAGRSYCPCAVTGNRRGCRSYLCAQSA